MAGARVQRREEFLPGQTQRILEPCPVQKKFTEAFMGNNSCKYESGWYDMYAFVFPLVRPFVLFAQDT